MSVVGLSPKTADEVNNLIGTHMRQFVDLQNVIGGDHDWLLAADLQAEPYLMSAEDETLIKSAVGDLDTALDGIQMTFINRLVGLYG